MKKTLGEMVDELSIVNIKMSKWNHEKLLEYAKKKPNKDRIIELDGKVMKTNERRVALKNGINEMFGQMSEERTYEISGSS